MANDTRMDRFETGISGAGGGIAASSLAGLSAVPLVVKNRFPRADLSTSESQKLRELLDAKNI